MSSSKSALAILLASVCLGGQAAQAQTNPLTYWTPGWPMGLTDATSGEGAATYSNFPGFNYSDTGRGYATARYNFSNGWFVGAERSTMGYGMSGIASGMTTGGAFGNLRYDGAQFGYNFRGVGNTPVTFFAGFDSLKYNPPGAGGPLAPFSGNPGVNAGYTARAGLEFRPTSNVTLSFGAGFTQQGAERMDSDIHSQLLPGQSPVLFGGR